LARCKKVSDKDFNLSLLISIYSPEFETWLLLLTPLEI